MRTHIARQNVATRSWWNFMVFSSVASLVLAVGAISAPQWFDDKAYQWVLDNVAPLHFWAVVWAVLAAGLGSQVTIGRNWVFWPMVGVFAITQTIFALSIFVATFSGTSEGDLPGAVMWSGYAFFGWRALFPEWRP